MNDYAKQNAKGFILPGETELPDDYPVHYGYAYVVVFDDGEVVVISSGTSGTIADLRRDMTAIYPGKTVAEMRRCELVERMQMRNNPNVETCYGT